MSVSIRDSDWLADRDLQAVLAILNRDGEEAYVAGGAVRNALIGQAVSDIDIATTCLPQEVTRRGERAGFKVIPTGIEHGTVTIVSNGHPFEVTTLRQDIETDGRRAKVRFGRDWRADAERRDFTINGLYAKADGTVVDLVGGIADIEKRILRFIGEPEARIREDYLRILRFFRFFAWYGSGRPDSAGLKACARLKSGLDGLSAERIWAELKKLLAAPDPSRALLWMRQAGVLTAVLPETEKWGIDAIHGLVETETALDWKIDPLLRLASIVPPDAERMAKMADRLRFSGADKERMTQWAMSDAVSAELSEAAFVKLAYRTGIEPLCDRLRLSLAAARTRGATDDTALLEAGGYGRLLKFVQSWKRPRFPVYGKDLLANGFLPGPELGRVLSALEDEWIEAGFKPDKQNLLDRASDIAGVKDT